MHELYLDEKAIANHPNMTEDQKEKRNELGKKYLENIKQYGHATWYSWHRANWGTKWNAYDQILIGDDIIEFYTTNLKIIYKKFWISMLVFTNLMVSALSNSSRCYNPTPFLHLENDDKKFNPDNRGDCNASLILSIWNRKT